MASVNDIKTAEQRTKYTGHRASYKGNVGDTAIKIANIDYAADLRAYAEQLEAERDSYKTAAELAVESQNRAQSDAERAEKRAAELAAALAREQRDVQSLATLLRNERERFEFLHSTNCDADGWEWGVARVRLNANGRIEHLWGVSDHSDIDAARAAQVSQPVGAVVAAKDVHNTKPLPDEFWDLVANCSGTKDLGKNARLLQEWVKSYALAAQTAAPGVKPVAYRITFGDFLHFSGAMTSGRDYVQFNQPSLDSRFFEGCDSLVITPLYAAPAPAAPLDISGLTRYAQYGYGEWDATVIRDDEGEFIRYDDVQALIDAQRGGA